MALCTVLCTVQVAVPARMPLVSVTVL